MPAIKLDEFNRKAVASKKSLIKKYSEDPENVTVELPNGSVVKYSQCHIVGGQTIEYKSKSSVDSQVQEPKLISKKVNPEVKFSAMVGEPSTSAEKPVIRTTSEIQDVNYSNTKNVKVESIMTNPAHRTRSYVYARKSIDDWSFITSPTLNSLILCYNSSCYDCVLQGLKDGLYSGSLPNSDQRVEVDSKVNFLDAFKVKPAESKILGLCHGCRSGSSRKVGSLHLYTKLTPNGALEPITNGAPLATSVGGIENSLVISSKNRIIINLTKMVSDVAFNSDKVVLALYKAGLNASIPSVGPVLIDYAGAAYYSANLWIKNLIQYFTENISVEAELIVGSEIPDGQLPETFGNDISIKWVTASETPKDVDVMLIDDQIKNSPNQDNIIPFNANVTEVEFESKLSIAKPDKSNPSVLITAYDGNFSKQFLKDLASVCGNVLKAMTIMILIIPVEAKDIVKSNEQINTKSNPTIVFKTSLDKDIAYGLCIPYQSKNGESDMFLYETAHANLKWLVINNKLKNLGYMSLSLDPANLIDQDHRIQADAMVNTFTRLNDLQKKQFIIKWMANLSAAFSDYILNDKVDYAITLEYFEEQKVLTIRVV